MSRIELRQVAWLTGATAILAVVAQVWLRPALPPPARIHASAAVWLLVAAVGLYGLAFLRQHALDWRDLRQVTRRALASEREELDDLRRGLQRVHAAFRSEQLHDERDQIRRLLATRSIGPRERLEWLRLLAVEGPASDAWIGLSRCLTLLGQPADAVRCAAEAARAGVAEPGLAFGLAEAILADAATPGPARSPGSPAWLLRQARHVPLGDPAALRQVYEHLADGATAAAVRGLAAGELLHRTGDREELARQRELLTPAATDDAQLRVWLAEAWSAYRRGPDGRRSLPWIESSWVSVAGDIVPRHWQAAVGLPSPPGAAEPPAYLDPLPTFAVPGRERLEALAAEVAAQTSSVPEALFGPDTTADTLAEYLTTRLWPRARRSRRLMEEFLAKLVDHDSPRHIATALEPLGAALCEEHGGGLRDLCELTEAAARRLPPGPFAARALHAAGYAWLPREPLAAEMLWEESLRQAQRLEPAAARPVLARFAPTYLLRARLAESPAAASQAMLLAAGMAVDSGSREALLGAVQSTCGLPASRLREGLVARLTAASGLMDDRARFLLARHAGDVAAMAAILPRLWHTDGDGPPATWIELARGIQLGPERLGAPPHPWLWCAVAIAEAAGPGDERALEGLVDGFAERGREGDAPAVAAWLALAVRLDALQDRPSRPAARKALDLVATRLDLALAAPLQAVRWSLLEPSPRWLDSVEVALLKRIRAEARRSTRYQDLDLIRATIAELGPAHIRALIETWLQRYRADIATWIRSTLAG